MPAKLGHACPTALGSRQIALRLLAGSRSVFRLKRAAGRQITEGRQTEVVFPDDSVSVTHTMSS